MSVLLVVIVAAGAVGAVSFFLKLLLTKGVRRIEGMINIAITDTTDIANDQVLPERWRDEVNRKIRRLPQERRDEVAKRIVLQRLDRLIGRVERGTGGNGRAAKVCAAAKRASHGSIHKCDR